jgi:hypothetical protein
MTEMTAIREFSPAFATEIAFSDAKCSRVESGRASSSPNTLRAGVRRRGLADYGELAQQYVDRFDQRWVRSRAAFTFNQRRRREPMAVADQHGDETLDLGSVS